MRYLKLTILIILTSFFNSYAQNSPLTIWGTGLDGSAYQTTAIYSIAPDGLIFEAPKDATGAKLPIGFGWRGGGGFALRISPNGNVGIGTSNPAEKLSVNGKIRSQEIKVEIANWPDYVFAKGYELPSLWETEKQIKEHGHLPGIPSATEVKTNGIDLGDMNAKLLKKIEELTLHMIEMKKEIDQLKQLTRK